MSLKKVLVITYYWPPAGGVEVHRVVKFCKYLPLFGYEPIVLTVRGGTATASDPALCAEVAQVSTVVRAMSLEPHSLFHWLTGGRRKTGATAATSAAGSGGVAHTLGEAIRLNLFVPDARIGWFPAAVRAGHALIAREKPDLIFSTAPPYTVHLIASRLAKRHGLPWVADFRDPWVENYAYNTTYRLPWIRWINERMERRVLNAADRVVVATPGQQVLQGAKARDGEGRFRTITNGHDFDTVPESRPASRFFLSYLGSMSGQRVPEALFDTLADLIRQDSAFAADFLFRFAGRATPEALQKIESRLPEANRLFLPMLAHEKYRDVVREHQLLLVLVDRVPHNELILPAKCLEMITTGNPMLAVGPLTGDTDVFLQTHRCGTLVDYEDREAMRTAILHAYRAWKDGTLNAGARPAPELHRRELTRRLAEVFREVG